MAFVVFRFQSLVDTDIDPYWFGKMGESLARATASPVTARSSSGAAPPTRW